MKTCPVTFKPCELTGCGDAICLRKPVLAPGMTGWRCPTCGAGVSPFAQACPYCAPPVRITC